MEERFSGIAYAISEVHIEAANDMISELYVYTLADGTNGSILYVGKAAGPTKVTEINCSVSCDCREQYHLGTNTASCSCSDCVMTVTTREQ